MDTNSLSVATYNKIAHIFSERYGSELSDTIYVDQLLALLPIGSAVLDIGCGIGTITKYIYHKGFGIEGIDLSFEMIAIAKDKYPEIPFSIMDMRTLTYPHEQFDAITCLYALIHLSSNDVDTALAGFNRVLKPHGYLELIVQKGNGEMIIDEPLMRSEKIFFHLFTQKSLQQYLERSGFEIVLMQEEKNWDEDCISEYLIHSIARKK